VATKEGLPIAYEVFDGNRSNVTTTQEMVEIMEKKYGKANRVAASLLRMAADEDT
jgi:transposase